MVAIVATGRDSLMSSLARRFWGPTTGAEGAEGPESVPEPPHVSAHRPHSKYQ